MAQTQRAQGPSDPEATGGDMSDSHDAPELWGNGGLVGDGRYRLTRRLGRGGMAEVFAAEDVRLGRTVAVKLLRSDLAEDPVSKARFTREAQSVAGLNHHAVVAVYDSGEDRVGNSTVPYIVMEIVEGHTIRDLLVNAEAPGPEQALIIVSGVLEALAYSHQHGIVHRDIKLSQRHHHPRRAVKVMDFGIARALHGAQSTMTQTGMVMGTPQYLSPEQALGKAVDHRSDLYATGCLLYELLALRPRSPARRRSRWSTSTSRTRRSRRPRSPTRRRRSWTAWSCAPRQGPGRPVPERRGDARPGPVRPPDAPAAGRPHPDLEHRPRRPARGRPHPGHGRRRHGWPRRPSAPRPGHDAAADDPAAGRARRRLRGRWPPGGSGRGRMWLIAVLAVLAIVGGVAFAMNGLNENEGDKPPVKPSPTSTKETSSPSASPTDEETDGETAPGDTGGNQQPYPPEQTGDSGWSNEQPTEDTPESPANPTPTDEQPSQTEEPPPTEEEPPPTEEEPPPTDGSPPDGETGGVQ
ncbi:protein kinase [Actinomadura keratinilytica]